VPVHRRNDWKQELEKRAEGLGQRAFYERFGFGITAQESVPDGPLVWGLIRR
jgi:hypothetical protein